MVKCVVWDSELVMSQVKLLVNQISPALLLISIQTHLLSFFSFCAGVYFPSAELDKDTIKQDKLIWDKLDKHNEFIASRIQSLSKSAFQNYKTIAAETGIPNWSNTEWSSFQKEFCIAGNVIITYDDFYCKAHQDKNDLNEFTYGIFSYIDKQSGIPIPSPCSDQKGHGLFFPNHSCIVDFSHANGIVEIIWNATKFLHQTTPPPDLLKTSDHHTHFGCSFQINKKLATVARTLQNASDSVIAEKIAGRSKMYAT